MHERIHGSRTEKAIMASCALMCVILICAFVTNGADAEQEQDAVTLDHLEYTLNADGTAELTDYDYETLSATTSSSPHPSRLTEPGTLSHPSAKMP